MESNNWELIAKYLSDKTSEEEERELFKWIKQHPKNEERFKDARKLWKHFPEDNEGYTPNTEQKWEELKTKLLRSDKKVKVRSLQPKIMWLAASMVLIVGLTYRLTTSFNSKVNYSNVSTKDNLEVFYLPDSSLIWLNKNSHLSYPEGNGGKERIVYLKGEAFFKVKRDSLRPFKIFTDSCLTTVLGTSFNIKAYETDPEVEVTVATGKVNLSVTKDTVREHFLMLKPHDIGRYNKVNSSVQQDENHNPNYDSWKGNLNDLKKTVLYQKEATNISSYVQNDCEWRQNLLKQTIIDGEIDNNAALVTYKNIKFKVTYYSHGGHKIATKHFLLNSVIGPGKTILYSYKLNHWFSNTTKVIVEVEGGDVFEKN
jgi:ferric-dicitrate binding protein FerR (iron transport regulator)